MIFKQFYLESLGHASYFIGSEQTGDAFVLDVRRDVDVYFEEARRHGMRLRYAADTHQHNDYLSGVCELPARDGVQLLASARAALEYPVRALRHRERLEMGEVVFDVLETPGYTPEHIAFLVRDRSRGEEPALLLSGGALLVDDVGRPDLLGSPAEVQRDARTLCRTLKEEILALPDHVQVYPTHVAGSLCGAHIGSRLSTTIGYERRLNRALAHLDADDRFVAHCLDLTDLPVVPPYWRRMRRMNIQGAPVLGVLPEPPALAPEAFEARRKEGALVLDARTPEAFNAHVPGAINVGAGASFATWAGTVVPASARILLVIDDAGLLWELVWQLLRVGYDPPEGWLAGGMTAWRTAGRPLEMLPQWSVGELRERRARNADLMVLDVRQPAEWTAGHVPGARHLAGGELPARLDELPCERPIAVMCSSGYRSSVAASVLRHRGHRHVANVLGGMTAWKNAGFDVSRD